MPRVVSAIQGASEADGSFHLPPSTTERFSSFCGASRLRGRVAKIHVRKSLSQRLHVFRSVQLSEAPLRFEPKRRGFGMSATAFFGQSDEAASPLHPPGVDLPQ